MITIHTTFRYLFEAANLSLVVEASFAITGRTLDALTWVTFNILQWDKTANTEINPYLTIQDTIMLWYTDSPHHKSYVVSCLASGFATIFLMTQTEHNKISMVMIIHSTVRWNGCNRISKHIQEDVRMLIITWPVMSIGTMLDIGSIARHSICTGTSHWSPVLLYLVWISDNGS